MHLVGASLPNRRPTGRFGANCTPCVRSYRRARDAPLQAEDPDRALDALNPSVLGTPNVTANSRHGVASTLYEPATPNLAAPVRFGGLNTSAREVNGWSAL